MAEVDVIDMDDELYGLDEDFLSSSPAKESSPETLLHSNKDAASQGSVNHASESGNKAVEEIRAASSNSKTSTTTTQQLVMEPWQIQRIKEKAARRIAKVANDSSDSNSTVTAQPHHQQQAQSQSKNKSTPSMIVSLPPVHAKKEFLKKQQANNKKAVVKLPPVEQSPRPPAEVANKVEFAEPDSLSSNRKAVVPSVRGRLEAAGALSSLSIAATATATKAINTVSKEKIAIKEKIIKEKEKEKEAPPSSSSSHVNHHHHSTSSASNNNKQAPTLAIIHAHPLDHHATDSGEGEHQHETNALPHSIKPKLPPTHIKRSSTSSTAAIAAIWTKDPKYKYNDSTGLFSSFEKDFQRESRKEYQLAVKLAKQREESQMLLHEERSELDKKELHKKLEYLTALQLKQQANPVKNVGLIFGAPKGFTALAPEEKQALSPRRAKVPDGLPIRRRPRFGLAGHETIDEESEHGHGQSESSPQQSINANHGGDDSSHHSNNTSNTNKAVIIKSKPVIPTTHVAKAQHQHVQVQPPAAAVGSNRRLVNPNKKEAVPIVRRKPQRPPLVQARDKEQAGKVSFNELETIEKSVAGDSSSNIMHKSSSSKKRLHSPPPPSSHTAGEVDEDEDNEYEYEDEAFHSHHSTAILVHDEMLGGEDDGEEGEVLHVDVFAVQDTEIGTIQVKDFYSSPSPGRSGKSEHNTFIDRKQDLEEGEERELNEDNWMSLEEAFEMLEHQKEEHDTQAADPKSNHKKSENDVKSRIQDEVEDDAEGEHEYDEDFHNTHDHNHNTSTQDHSHTVSEVADDATAEEEITETDEPAAVLEQPPHELRPMNHHHHEHHEGQHQEEYEEDFH